MCTLVSMLCLCMHLGVVSFSCLDVGSALFSCLDVSFTPFRV